MGRRKKIYLAGGMTAFGKDKFEESNEWREDLQKRIFSMSGCLTSPINPNDHFNFLYNTDYDSEREIMNYDLRRVRDSDLIIVNFNDPNSIGTAIEIGTAVERRIPILGLRENEEMLHPWLELACERIFADRVELAEYVIRHYID